MVDNYAEKYLSFSPYNYVANSPITYVDPTGDTLVISLFKKGSKFDKAAMQMVSNPHDASDGVFIIASHADPTYIENEKHFENKHEKILNTGEEITLILAGCNTASSPEEYTQDARFSILKPIAQRVSKAEGNITVKGADGYIGYGEVTRNNEGIIGQKGNLGINGIRSLTGDNGGWVSYKGGEETGNKVVVGMSKGQKFKKLVQQAKESRNR